MFHPNSTTVEKTAGGQAWLYQSAVDHKLHLRGAESGVWNLDDLHRLRYARLGGDAYLKQLEAWIADARDFHGANYTNHGRS